MKRKIFVLLIIFCIVLMTGSTVQSATSALDNIPGGAGIAYWQAGGGWGTLISISETYGQCALLFIGVYDGNGNRLLGFNMPLIPSDTVGIVVHGDGSNIYLFDYSDTAYGGSATLNDISTGPPLILPAPPDTDGILRGYLTVVRTNIGCAGPGGAPSGNITGTGVTVPDYLLIRTALVNLYSAFAFNGTMLQGFANIAGTIDENGDFIDASASPNAHRACDFNNDGDTIDSFASMDHPSGADIDFAELFLTENVSLPPDIVCNPPGYIFFKALGASNHAYCGRFNENPSAGTQTMLILIAPQSNHPSAKSFLRSYSGWIFDDNGDSTGISRLFNVVEGIPFATGTVMSGEICFVSTVPLIGFTYTETAFIADVYPLLRSQVGVMSLNRDNVDDTIDIITLP